MRITKTVLTALGRYVANKPLLMAFIAIGAADAARSARLALILSA